MADAKKIEERAIRYSMLAALSIFIVETTTGMLVGSLAIMSDGLHALLDLISTLILLISIRVSLKPPDEEHMYGHEKFEYIGGMIGGIILIALAALMASNAASVIISGEVRIKEDLSLIGYIALAYTLIIDLARTLILGLRAGFSGPVVKAALYHAVSDLCSTLIALFGFWLSTRGIPYGDSVASLGLSAALIFLSVRFVWANMIELSDIAPREEVRRVKEEITRLSGGLFAYENLRVRKVGRKFFVRATLKVPDYMGLEEAHEAVTRIERGIAEALGEADVSFHIEPSGVRGMPTREFIKEVASSVEGVMDAHDISIVHHDGRAHVSLHIQVDPGKSLSEAHEIAERVERTIRASVGGIENIFVHIEPSTIEQCRGGAVSDREVDEVVREVIGKYGDRVKIKRIVTHLAGGRRQISIECILSKDVSVKEAHEIAHEIEDKVKEKISEVSVTVHMEANAD